MNVMPLTWSEDLQAAYPKRSGPCGWRGMRLMLALRRALFESTWEQIIDGCKNYKAYCQASGREGTDYVQAPQRFIEDQSYLESFTYQAPEDPKVTEHKRKEAERFARAVADGRLLSQPLSPEPGECAAAFETRIMLQRTQGPVRRDAGADIGTKPQNDISAADFGPNAIAGLESGAKSIQSIESNDFGAISSESARPGRLHSDVSRRVTELAARMRIAK